MAEVDVEDDSIRRFVVRHYRYDPERRQRRHVVVAAFDTKAEFHSLLDSIHDDIESRRTAGVAVHHTEHASGVVYEPGDRRRAATGHLVRSMMAHGVDPGPRIDMNDLPSNMGLFSVDEGRGARLRSLRHILRRGLRWLGRP